MKHYELISRLGIHIAEESIQVELGNVDLFFKAWLFQTI